MHPLTNVNYLAWRVQFTPVLHGDKLMKYVEGKVIILFQIDLVAGSIYPWVLPPPPRFGLFFSECTHQGLLREACFFAVSSRKFARGTCPWLYT